MTKPYEKFPKDAHTSSLYVFLITPLSLFPEQDLVSFPAEHDQKDAGNFIRHTKKQKLVHSLGLATKAILAHVTRLN